MRLPSKTKLAEEYVTLAEKRRYKGLAVYGDFDPKEDDRILAWECIEEIVDAYNYLYFAKQKYPKFKTLAQKAQKQLFDAFVTLRHLEELERDMNPETGGDT